MHAEHKSFGIQRCQREGSNCCQLHKKPDKEKVIMMSASMHRVRALSTKINNDRADGHCYIALLGFNDLGRSVTPIFLFRNMCFYNYLHIVQK